MASKLGFRNHMILLLFMDLFILFFAGLGTDSFIGEFLANPEGISLVATAGIGAVFVAIFAGISAIGVTSGSNFAGIPGIIAGFMGKTAGTATIMGVVMAVLVDYVFIYNTILGGITSDWSGFWIQLAAMVMFFPLIIDALFASIDWARGVQT